MAWHNEWPHKVCASVLLLDGKIEGWKTGYPPKKEPGEFRAYWKRDRLNDYTVEHTCFEVNNDQEHNDAFEILAPEWFRQWELADDLHGSPPYKNKEELTKFTIPKPHCYGKMDWILKYLEDNTPNESICRCQFKNSCLRLTRNKQEVGGF